jgi:hypothetical protein
MDPLRAETWYSISSVELANEVFITYLLFKSMISHLTLFVQHEGTTSLLAYYNGSVVKALLDLFPELDLDTSKFAFLQSTFF